ncbi:GNAT family N-acetyltransferase [Nocardia sp. SYP-A9097]|uniref:GNAT family N-acetyltransferase n=1 Tax=Nocardia sp. SYP-A9097 TaxID=2663237 RepID=UPI00129A2881|nr:GNAT family N-acetyltransferase [Nocardia sp. SYP-A9097]MRH86390.1 GNAT family N-acetyltransferase [Nocardia sp. SYP-A9097]
MTTIVEAALSSPVYRVPERDDLPDIQNIDAAAFRDRYPYFVLRQLLEAHSSRCVVAVEPGNDGDGDGTVVGYALTIGEGARAWLISLAVSRDRRGRGYGRGLLQHTVQVCLEAGVDELLLTVDPKNTPAKTLFEEFGFVVHDRDERYFGDDEPRDVLLYKLHRVPDPLPAVVSENGYPGT